MYSSAPDNRGRIAWVLGIVAAGYVALLVLGFQAAPRSTAQSGKPSIVAAENFWGDIAAQVAGDHATVTSLVSDLTADPHLYESGARDAAGVAGADIVLYNGAGYDEFMNRLLRASTNPRRTVLSAADIAGVSGNQANPHIWYDLSSVTQVAGEVAASLTARDPDHAAAYAQNLRQFEAGLLPVRTVYQQIRQAHPGAPVAATEPIAAYLLQAAGLRDITPAGYAAAVEQGSDPSPSDAAAMTELIRTRQVKLLLYNSQAVTPVTAKLRATAISSGVPVVALTETMPTSEPNYQTWQLHQAQAILKALSNQ